LLWVRKRLPFTATKFEGVASRHASNAWGAGKRWVVEFHGVELSNVIVEHLTGRQFRRVERALPVLVVKPGGTDTNGARHARCRFDAIEG